MGVTVRQKVKGKGKPWWVFVSYDNQRTSKMIGSKDAANAVARTIEAKLALGEFSFEEEKRVPIFKEYAESWIKTTVPATCKESTTDDYRAILKNHVLPVFSSCRVNEITRGKIKDFLLDKISSGKRKATVSHMKSVISGVLDKAVDDEVIQSNPALGIRKILKIDDQKEHIDPLSAEELDLLLNAFREHFSEHYTMILLLSRTGVRSGEALALQWEDIDFNGRFIEIRRSYVRDKITTPKNKKSRRVDMSKQLAETLKIHMTECKEKGLRLGFGDAPEYVFTNQYGRLLDKNNWRKRVFDKALKKAGIRGIRVHDIRHTYATLRIAKGDNIADVSKQLGHHSVKLTMDVYYHWVPGKKKSEVDELDNLGAYRVQIASTI